MSFFDKCLALQPLNGDTDDPCHGLPACHFKLLKPFNSRFRVGHGPDREMDRQWSSMHVPSAE